MKNKDMKMDIILELLIILLIWSFACFAKLKDLPVLKGTAHITCKNVQKKSLKVQHWDDI